MKFLFLLSLCALLIACNQAGTQQIPPFVSSASCTTDSLLSTQNFQKKNYIVKNFTLNAAQPSEGSGGEAYFVGDTIDHIIAGYYATIGKTELLFSFATPDDYIVDVAEYTYEKPLDASNYTSVVHERFFVCDGEPLNCEGQENCAKFSWAKSELEKIRGTLSM